MLQSNQPYQRVDDGVGAGFVSGAVIGGAGALSANAVVNRRAMKDSGMTGADIMERVGSTKDRFLSDRYQSRYSRAKGKEVTRSQAKQMAGRKVQNDLIKEMDSGKTKAVGQFAFGNGKRRAITAGASMLSAGLLGAGIDGANN